MHAVLKASSIDQLLEALAFHALQSVHDIATDLVNDPATVMREGVPTKAQQLDRAHDAIFGMWPDMMDDFDGFRVEGEQLPEGTTPFEAMMMLAVRKVAQDNPRFLQFTVQAR